MFEQFPGPENSESARQEQKSSQESEASIEFDPDLGLDGILDILVSMQAQQLFLEGSSSTYTPAELAYRINKVLVAATERVIAYDQELAETMAERLKTGGTLEPLEIDDLEELNAITRTGGLRDAVTNAVRELSNNFKGRFPRHSLPMSEHAYHQYQGMTGQRLGQG